MERIRVGFIGCGGNASGHIGRIHEMSDAQVVALCDPSAASLERARERNATLPDNIPTFFDHKQMLEQVEMDAVEISTPHTLHFEQITNALDRGLHVLTEKPMVCTVEHAHKVMAHAQKADRILMVAYQRHLQPIYRYLRNQISCGEMGEIQFISAMQDQGWYRGTKGLWRQTLSLSGGGQLNDSGSHLLDIVLWMTGLAVDEVQAYVENFESEVDINSALSLRFKGGAIGNISVIGNAPSGGMWEDITIYGSKAAAYIRNGHLTYKAAGAEPSEPSNLPGATSPDRNFIDAICGRDEVQVPPVCGLRVIELTEAAWESARTGKPASVKTAK
jgi:predicted dehydrogenase